MWECFGAFRYPNACKMMRNWCVSVQNALFRGTEVPTNVFTWTHPIASIRPKMMFVTVFEHLDTRRNTNRWETGACRYQNALFRGTEVPTNVFTRTHPIASIRPKMMFGSILEHFGTTKPCKTMRSWCVSVPECTVSGNWSSDERFHMNTPNSLD